MAKNEFDITSLTPEQRDARLALDVERLLRFGRKHKLIKDLDILVARNTLLDLLAADPAFGLTRQELDALMEPKRYIGRCPQQVARFLAQCAPLLRQAHAADGDITL